MMLSSRNRGVVEEERIEIGGAFVVLGPRCSGISSMREEGWFRHGGRDDEKSEYEVVKGDVVEERRRKS